VAHRDVVIASNEAEFADHTVSVLGDAIQCVCLLQNASLLTNHRQRRRPGLPYNLTGIANDCQGQVHLLP
jgi:hypothetical protein